MSINIEGLKATFAKLDTNHDGGLDRAEFFEGIKGLGVTDRAVSDGLYTIADGNHDEKLELKEFIYMFYFIQLDGDFEKKKEIYIAFQKGDYSLDVKEIYPFIKIVNLEILEEAFPTEIHDYVTDGKVTFENFYKFCLAKK
ncbi:hypothetical protein EIN_094120 [Entamoeba invadens IP1]|uniref:EF-hand domain-containing protein n=1 Tax=Entamoeba invadens IP1 TaxID=370355 RepID=A0A0A1U002_ENTIV|nr:hypothetical protein EIN_094120 [Entamoeba invadens IP1]ELP87225.1 hypothetical protein EIN_094120 [Entamoeba invadens IP1]|eukprot:XP_004253996.1 hypothetical protein EIN_094120 [Entamoeba invadens IP1]